MNTTLVEKNFPTDTAVVLTTAYILNPHVLTSVISPKCPYLCWTTFVASVTQKFVKCKCNSFRGKIKFCVNYISTLAQWVGHFKSGSCTMSGQRDGNVVNLKAGLFFFFGQYTKIHCTDTSMSRNTKVKMCYLKFVDNGSCLNRQA
jgi:hypothetical protein